MGTMQYYLKGSALAHPTLSSVPPPHSDLYEHHCNPSTGRVLFSAAQRLCQMLEADVPMVLPEGTDLPVLIHNLACQAITFCHQVCRFGGGREGV